MQLKTEQVGVAFWNKRNAMGSSVHSSGDKLFSYGTVLLQRLPSGRVIGNATKYSTTTSRHQSQVGVRTADVLVTGVPRGETDLKRYVK